MLVSRGMGSGSANLDVSQTMEEFKDFQRYVKGVDPYGMQSGIVVIDPPEEWYVNAWLSRQSFYRGCC